MQILTNSYQFLLILTNSVKLSTDDPDSQEDMEDNDKIGDKLVLVPGKKILALLKKCQLDGCTEHALPSNIKTSVKGESAVSSVYL